MNKHLNKYKIIQILFALAVILLIANLLVDRFSSELESKPKVEFDKNISTSKVDSVFLSSLKNYNIKQNWIHKITRKNSTGKSFLLNYKIDIPQDLPVILIIKEIYNNFSTTKLKIVSNEVKEDGTSLIEIMNANKPVLTAKLKYKENIVHLAGYLNLIILVPEDLNFKDKRELLNSLQKITLAFKPTMDQIDFVNNINVNNKEYALMIDENIDELKFKIENNFDEKRNKQAINSILDSYQGLKIVLITSNFIPNNTIKNTFLKKGIKLVYQKKLVNFIDEYKNNFRKMFHSYVINTSTNDTLNVILSFENYEKAKSEFKKIRKLGYKFSTY